MMELAQEKNKEPLPLIPSEFGVLPPPQFSFTKENYQFLGKRKEPEKDENKN